MIKLIKYPIKWFLALPLSMHVKRLGKNAKLTYPIRVERGSFISIGDNSEIYSNAFLQAVQEVPTDRPSLQIGNNVRIWSNVQISAAQEMIIGNNVVLSANSFVTDTTHPYEDITHAPRYNHLKKLGKVVIGDDTWIGRNAIVSGCSLGKHCVVGANTFVTKDIPDYCVVVGNPCRIVKRYNFSSQQWEKTDKDGNFV